MAQIDDRRARHISALPRIEDCIQTVRGLRVIIDVDLALLYGVPTKRLNEQVKRNIDRFPADFLFRLTATEKVEVVANCDHLNKLKFSKSLPYAFTEHGAIQASNVLASSQAVEMNRFTLRGRAKVGAQWSLYCLVHNIESWLGPDTGNDGSAEDCRALIKLQDGQSGADQVKTATTTGTTRETA